MVPTFPSSLVPRAKITVTALQVSESPVSVVGRARMLRAVPGAWMSEASGSVGVGIETVGSAGRAKVVVRREERVRMVARDSMVTQVNRRGTESILNDENKDCRD